LNQLKHIQNYLNETKSYLSKKILRIRKDKEDEFSSSYQINKKIEATEHKQEELYNLARKNI